MWRREVRGRHGSPDRPDRSDRSDRSGWRSRRARVVLASALVLAAAVAAALVVWTPAGGGNPPAAGPSLAPTPPVNPRSAPVGGGATPGGPTASRPPRRLTDADAGGPPVPTPPTLADVRNLTGWLTAPGGPRMTDLDATSVTADGLSRGGAASVRLDVSPSARAQPMQGFGAALTESSAVLLTRLPDDQRAAVLRSLFSPTTGAGLSVVRIPMGASDFAEDAYTYDDRPPGQTDPELRHFSVARDDRTVVPVLREILRINPQVRVTASPWSAPAWMKVSGQLDGGSLDPRWYGAWAQYFVRFVQAYASRGIQVSTVTVQNEPGHSDGSYPTMTMSAGEEATFVASQLGPAFAAARLSPQIIGYDHNWDTPDYPSALLGNPAAARYLAGVAWHCYRGDASAQSVVHARFPDKIMMLSECSGGDWNGAPADSLTWLADVLVGTTRNWSSTALLWNLALDSHGGPHHGGCVGCRGVLTIDPRPGTDLRSVDRSLEFDLLGLAARAAPRGSVRIDSQTSSGDVSEVAFVDPDGRRSVLAHNRTGSTVRLGVHDGGPPFTVRLPPHALTTFRWPP